MSAPAPVWRAKQMPVPCYNFLLHPVICPNPKQMSAPASVWRPSKCVPAKSRPGCGLETQQCLAPAGPTSWAAFPRPNPTILPPGFVMDTRMPVPWLTNSCCIRSSALIKPNDCPPRLRSEPQQSRHPAGPTSGCHPVICPNPKPNVCPGFGLETHNACPLLDHFVLLCHLPQITKQMSAPGFGPGDRNAGLPDHSCSYCHSP
eukprot:gene17765-24134_t